MKKEPPQPPTEANDKNQSATPKPVIKPVKTKLDLEQFPCKLGDVVLRAGGDEAWLAGGLVFSEDLPVAVLYIAPDAGGDRALYVKPSPQPSLTWLSPLAEGTVLITGEPPSAIEQGGDRFDRVRRLPLRVTRIGSGAPDVGDSAIVAEYTTAAGDVLLVLASSGTSRAWRGSPLEEGTYDVLPNGEGDNPAES